MRLTGRDVAIHGGLFVACCLTTTLQNSLAFGATLMAILTCHEFGHYIVARRHGIDVSLPYFIPLPLLSFGTLGAVIRMNRPIEDRRALFDVGAAGPIAGLVVAIPLLVIGLSISDVGPTTPDGTLEGNSLLYILLKYLVFGMRLPNDYIDVNLHPMALAAWVGLLVTMINLMPIGQLDGGHVARAAFGQTHEKWSQRLHVALPIVGAVVATVMFVAARAHGYGVIAALSYAKFGAVPWLVWTLMLAVIRGRSGEYHPAVGDVPLDPVRRWLAIGVLVVFLLIATPVPFRPVL
ncbi:MAG TPA: site-2 protease family protein [Kofleriaceae bacterium]|nr:site-2 protease family protein [Kofleriaceae bacterium]